MYYHNHISDFEALVNTTDTSTSKRPANARLTIITSLAFALITISIVFN